MVYKPIKFVNDPDESTPLNAENLNHMEKGIIDSDARTLELKEAFDAGLLKGDKGDQGEQGLQGEQGPKGDPGEQGLIGPAGADGVAGADGLQGPAGPEGPQGIQGPEGPAGIDGAKGETGDAWTRGLDGPQGPSGADGAKGETGETGPEGPQGIQGPAGESINIGKTYASLEERDADAANIPDNTLIFINSGIGNVNNGEFYTKVNGQFILGGVIEGIQGPNGERGERGPQGIQGIMGPEGPIGPQGLEGPQGERGDTGSRGLQGIPGLPGDVGPQGLPGDHGDIGPQGPEGPIGPQGPKGEGISIGHTYSSHADMEADKPNIPDNSLIFINSGVGNPNNGEFYSKTNGEFILNGVLEGIQGPQGPAGPQGANGERGLQGFGVSLKGTVSNEGEVTAKIPGARIGDAYWASETGILYIFTDDPNQVESPTFLKSPPLFGKDGAKGEQGDVGPQGIRGERGDVGQQGIQGPQGSQGPPGEKGEKGETGAGVTVTSPAANGMFSDMITNVSLIKQGRIANLTLSVSTKGRAKTAGSYESIGILPVGYRGKGFQTITITGGGRTVTLDVYENGNIYVVWTSARAAGDTHVNRMSITYFTES